MANNKSEKRYWYKEGVWYELYINLFSDSNNDGIGDIKGVIEKIPYFENLGISCIWILPPYPSTLKDYGYDVTDYKSIRKKLGNINDFKLLCQKLHDKNIKVILDLPINHTSYKHPWFIKSKNKESIYKDYYIWNKDVNKYTEAPIIFSDYEKSNWEYSKTRQEFYFHRFYKYQPDLNWENKNVLNEFIDIISFWAKLGVDGIRIDAAPYLIKKENTSCEDLKETHNTIKILKKEVNKIHPNIIFITEANEKIGKIKKYLNEVEMSFNFHLMQRTLLCVKTGNPKYITRNLERYRLKNDKAQFASFLRNHDEMTLSNLGSKLYNVYIKNFDKDKKYIFNGGISKRLIDLLSSDDKVLISFSILLSLSGTPIIYMGDERGMHDNEMIRKKKGYDKRDIIRDSINWEKYNKKILKNLISIIKIRKKYEEKISYIYPQPHFINDNLLSYRKDNLLFIHNIKNREIEVKKDFSIIFGYNIKELEKDKISLHPNSFLWAKLP
jgi:maltose alpha-D-glucosyltransferase/alpha-amylase